MNELEINVNVLPISAKKELRVFYDYLVFKYLKDLDSNESLPGTDSETENNLAAFQQFKKLRDHIRPVVDESLDIDALINEGNRDIF